MSAYGEELFELEQRFARAVVDDDDEERVYVAGVIKGHGDLACAVCGMMIRLHPYEGWNHVEPGLDHDARPDRGGFNWPQDLPLPQGRTSN